MSEAEKRRRQEYKRLRKKWMLVQAIILLVVTAIVLSMSITYIRINKTKYVDYTEKSDINYLVKLSANDFYEKDTLEKDRAYVTALVDKVDAEFDYELNMSAFADVVFSYSYTVDATLLITDKYTEAVVYDAVTELVPRMYYTQNGADKLSINETVSVDFRAYNDEAIRFITTYGLKNADAKLVLTMRMNAKSSCAEFENKAENAYFTTVTFPLASETTEPVTTSSVADGEVRTLACKSSRGATACLVLAIVFGAIELLLAAFFVFFIFKTKNHDINYTNRVKRLVANYRSFIQEITVPFATNGYQLVYIKTFNEMLDVRDTAGSPLLMYANEDGTATTFVIPTNAGLLYIYEIRVEDYDDIYGISDESGTLTDVVAMPTKADLCETMEAVWQKVKAAIIRAAKAVWAFICLSARKVKEFFCFLGRKIKEFSCFVARKVKEFFCFVGRKVKKLFSKKNKAPKAPKVVETPTAAIAPIEEEMVEEPMTSVAAKREKKRKAHNKRKTKPNKKKKRNPTDKEKKKTK